jgi:DNA-binding response OmpR family regulator
MSRILLIEPDAILAKTYAMALDLAGHTVDVTHDAQTAIYVADHNQPDLVLLEIQLTGHSGVEFLYEFRSYPDWRNIPVIIISNIPEKEFNPSRSLLFGELKVEQYYYKPRLSLKRLQTVAAEVSRS